MISCVWPISRPHDWLSHVRGLVTHMRGLTSGTVMGSSLALFGISEATSTLGRFVTHKNSLLVGYLPKDKMPSVQCHLASL